MSKWPDTRLLDLFGIELPILQAPMAGSTRADMAIAVSEVGGLGSLPTASLSIDQVRSELTKIRQNTSHPINLNFFCHTPPTVDPACEAAWRERLARYYTEMSLDPGMLLPSSSRAPFDDTLCEIVEEFKPEVVSFHFGLPAADLMGRVKSTGAKIISSATTVAEARWLEGGGCDAIIAQGIEAGGHRGIFLKNDTGTQIGTMSLVPQIVDAVSIPVIAAGGIGDARGIAAAFALGASAVQLGTTYLFCPESTISPVYREALRNAGDDDTAVTNVFTGRPARGIVNRMIREVGPISDVAPAFPLAGGAIAPLRAKAESEGSGDFSPLWAGQSVSLGRELPAAELTRLLAEEVLARL